MKLNWKNETVVIIGSGPSLNQQDVSYCYQKARVLVINDNWQLAPWADAIYGCDYRWWDHDEKKAVHTDFKQPKYRLIANPSDHKEKKKSEVFTGIFAMRNTGRDGIDMTWPGIKTGGNSGYQAINLVVHFGVGKIVLLGYDMKPSNKKKHWFGGHPVGLPDPSNANFADWIENFNNLAPILKEKGIEVVNCSRETALTCFDRADIRRVL